MLKKLTLLSCIVFLIYQHGATQRFYHSGASRLVPERHKTMQMRSAVMQDTIFWPTAGDPCSDAVTFYTITGDWGFVSGTNAYFDEEKAQKLTYSGDGAFKIIEVWAWFAFADAVGDGDLIARIYSVNANTGGPDALLGVSEPVKTSAVMLDAEDVVFTPFSFPNQGTIHGDQFFVSIDFTDLYAAGDTAALFMTDDFCGDGADSWELFGDGITWLPIDDADSWQIESDFLLGAVIEPDAGSTPAEMDTVVFPTYAAPCSETAFSFLSNAWGFVAGMNNFGDREKAQRLEYTANASYAVNEVWGFFADAAGVGNGTLRAKVYAVNPVDGSPGSLLATSLQRNVSDINLDPDVVVPTVFTFPGPPEINDEQFFVSIDFTDLYATEDTVGLFMTPEDCGDGSDSWELFNDGLTWTTIDDAGSWGLEADFWLMSVVDFEVTTSVADPFVGSGGLKLYPAFPNPAAETVSLKYAINSPADVRLVIFSSDGVQVSAHDLGSRQPGTHLFEIPVNTWPHGTYVYALIAGKDRLMSRFIVVE